MHEAPPRMASTPAPFIGQLLDTQIFTEALDQPILNRIGVVAASTPARKRCNRFICSRPGLGHSRWSRSVVRPRAGVSDPTAQLGKRVGA